MTNFFSTHLTTDVSDITNQMMGPLLGSPYHSFKSSFSRTWRRLCRVETLHYAAFHTRKCQLEMWARFSPQLIFLSFDYFRQNIWVSIFVQFHFQGIFGAKLDFPPTFLCFLISQNSNELCECFEDQLNIDLKSRLQMFFDDSAGKKYLKDICTRMGCTVKNVIFYFYSAWYDSLYQMACTR